MNAFLLPLIFLQQHRLFWSMCRVLVEKYLDAIQDAQLLQGLQHLTKIQSPIVVSIHSSASTRRYSLSVLFKEGMMQ